MILEQIIALVLKWSKMALLPVVNFIVLLLYLSYKKGTVNFILFP